jgi:hypothetical protein
VSRPFHRPTLFGPAAIDTLPGGIDPADRDEAAYATARLLVEGGRSGGDQVAVDRLVHLADEHGMDLLASMWSQAPADSLPGALWRLYVLRNWAHRQPRTAAEEFDRGRAVAPVLEVVAGVGEPPGPEAVVELTDAILRGVYSGDFAVAMERAAAFARVVAIGRASHPVAGDEAMTGVRMVRMAEHLESAARSWRSGDLQAR